MLRIFVCSASGGVCRSALVGMLAVHFASEGLAVEVVDDAARSLLRMQVRRLQQGFLPTFAVYEYADMSDALCERGFDVSIIEHRCMADKDIQEAAHASDLIVILSGEINRVDAQIRLANDLCEANTRKILFVLSNLDVTHGSEIDELNNRLARTSYRVAVAIVPMRDVYRAALERGVSLIEAESPLLRTRAIALVKEIVSVLDREECNREIDEPEELYPPRRQPCAVVCDVTIAHIVEPPPESCV